MDVKRLARMPPMLATLLRGVLGKPGVQYIGSFSVKGKESLLYSAPPHPNHRLIAGDNPNHPTLLPSMGLTGRSTWP
ncbi:hypothetical protein [Methylomonas koyamae]|uniref:hypothetical protein n=1 Tax=Methylomonas koyamae TaxID=702114 RepID=UPI0012F641BA|nr:hypothetical protein [Methylomonas koyamae]